MLAFGISWAIWLILGDLAVPFGTRAAPGMLRSFSLTPTKAFLAAFLPHAQVLQGDMPNYTDIEPVMQFSEIKLNHFVDKAYMLAFPGLHSL